MQTSQSVPLFILLTIVLPWKVESQTPITCSAGHYKPGEKASITCYYHGDIGTEKNTGLHITWYKLDAPKDSSGNEVLICHSKEGAVRVCNPEEGYRFLGINKDNLTIEVPDVSAEFQGRYSCGVVPGNGRVVRPCILLVEGAYELEKNTPRNPGTQETLHEHVKTTHALMILTFILMAVAVAAIIYLTLAYKKRWFPFKRKDQIQIADAEQTLVSNEENDNGEQLSVEFRSDKPGSVNSPLLTSTGVPQGPAVGLENSLPPNKDVDAQGSQVGRKAVKEEEPAGDKKPETDNDRKEREKHEKKEKADKKTERVKYMKERKTDATSKEESERIQKEYDEMYNRSHNAETKQKKRMLEQYDELTKGLKNTTSEEEKKRIQSEYDKQKEQWIFEKKQKKQNK